MPPPFSWTGFYVGINGGGGFGSSNWDSTGSRNISGGLVGGTVGYNYQFGQWVSGLEGDIDWADINGSTNNACAPGCKTSDSWLATARGRFGYAADRFLPFVTAGAAFGDIRASSPGFVSSSPPKPAGPSAPVLRPRSLTIGRPRSNISMSISAASIVDWPAVAYRQPIKSRSTPIYCAPA